ncbi:MAG: 23S rRNA (adenine(2503)-C(2))-methyltransferase RlmN [Myxococcota bacterium]
MKSAHDSLQSPAIDCLPEDWEDLVQQWGYPAYRGRQIFDWIHRRQVFEPESMVNLPSKLRAQLRRSELRLPLKVSDMHRSGDDTRKLLVRTDDERVIETVLIPELKPGAVAAYTKGDRTGEPNARVVTQCISSQVGCAMGCVFCASGVAGLKRQLNPPEIVGQVLLGKTRLDEQEYLRNVVLMGMGEPLHNYAAVARTLTLLFHPKGLALSKRRVTLSTSGLIPQIDQLARDFGGQVQLAISLHAVDDVLRSDLMPINRKYPLPQLIECLKRYPLPPRRRITIEYTLIGGVNDELRAADAMVRLLQGIPIKVNLIPMNPVEGSPLDAPAATRVHAFQQRLRTHGVSTFVRRQRGDEVDAACGQLALRGAKRKVRMRLPQAQKH